MLIYGDKYTFTMLLIALIVTIVVNTSIATWRMNFPITVISNWHNYFFLNEALSGEILRMGDDAGTLS